MLSRLERDDVYILGAVSGWLASFVLLAMLLKSAGIDLPLAERIAAYQYAPVIAFAFTVALLLGSVFAGLAVTDHNKGDASFLVGLCLAVTNMAWLALSVAILVSGDSFFTVLLLLGVPFYITWLAIQVSGVVRAVLFALPALIAWSIGNGLMLPLLAGILTLVYALAIKRAETAKVGRQRKALGLILFIQSVALTAVAVRLLESLGDAKGHREARNVAIATSIVDVMPFVERVSFGSRFVPIFYSATLWVALFSMMIASGVKPDWGSYLMVALWTTFLFSSVTHKPVSWPVITWILVMQAGTVVIFGGVFLVGLYHN